MQNKVEIVGTITFTNFFSHTSYRENFYRSFISVCRDSGVIDELPMIFPKYYNDKIHVGDRVRVTGEFHSYNEDGHLRLFIFANTIEPSMEIDKNQIVIEGTLCKPVILRETPKGRVISELLVAVNRNFGKSDYIPCIAWGRMAHISSVFQTGESIFFDGRIQSRKYYKNELPYTAYEVSINEIK